MATRWKVIISLFAIADLILAVLVFLFELILLATLAFRFEQLFLAGPPSSEPFQDRLTGMVGAIGMLILYLSALVTLPMGGVGLIMRRPWGYYSHLAGAALVAVSIFGVIYTIPALVVALQPEFKNYFFGKQELKPPSDPLGDW